MNMTFHTCDFLLLNFIVLPKRLFQKGIDYSTYQKIHLNRFYFICNLPQLAFFLHILTDLVKSLQIGNKSHDSFRNFVECIRYLIVWFCCCQQMCAVPNKQKHSFFSYTFQNQFLILHTGQNSFFFGTFFIRIETKIINDEQQVYCVKIQTRNSRTVNKLAVCTCKVAYRN